MEDEPMLVDFVDSMCRWGDASYDRYTIFGDVRLKFRTKRLTVRIKFKTP